MVPRLNLCMALLVTALLLGGCAQRTITVTSAPTGALVWLNDQEVGRTPVTVPFTFYGTYDVRMQHEGYEPLWTQRELDMPLWELPGPDLAGELIGARSEHTWHFELTPRQPVDEHRLIDRAMQLRAAAQTPASQEN